jgi:hypothetical protein
MTKAAETPITTTNNNAEESKIMGLFTGMHFPDAGLNKWHDESTSLLTPRDIQQLETMYANTTTIDKQNMFRAWQNRLISQKIVRCIHDLAKTLKADTIGQTAQSIYFNDLPDICYATGLDGTKQLTGAGVTYINNKHNALLKHSEILERGRWGEKRQERDKAIVVNANVTVSIKDLMQQPIENLVEADFTDVD